LGWPSAVFSVVAISPTVAFGGRGCAADAEDDHGRGNGPDHEHRYGRRERLRSQQICVGRGMRFQIEHNVAVRPGHARLSDPGVAHQSSPMLPR
jgi:hypothetical protein